jgi:hypothetical protein
VPALDFRTGIENRVNPLVPVGEALELNDRPFRQEVWVGGGDAGPHLNARCRRLAFAVRRGDKLGPASGRGQANPGSRQRPGVDDRRLVDEKERDRRQCSGKELPSEGAGQQHWWLGCP